METWLPYYFFFFSFFERDIQELGPAIFFIYNDYRLNGNLTNNSYSNLHSKIIAQFSQCQTQIFLEAWDDAAAYPWTSYIFNTDDVS